MLGLDASQVAALIAAGDLMEVDYGEAEDEG